MFICLLTWLFCCYCSCSSGCRFAKVLMDFYLAVVIALQLGRRGGSVVVRQTVVLQSRVRIRRLPSPQLIANLLVGCHLVWHLAAGWPLWGATEEKIVKNGSLVRQKHIKKKKKIAPCCWYCCCTCTAGWLSDRCPGCFSVTVAIYLAVVITVILIPSIWLLTWLLCCAVRKDMQLGEYTIQEGAMIMYNTYSLHMDPAHWTDPHQFRPERWDPLIANHSHLTQTQTKITKSPWQISKINHQVANTHGQINKPIDI